MCIVENSTVLVFSKRKGKIENYNKQIASCFDNFMLRRKK